MGSEWNRSHTDDTDNPETARIRHVPKLSFGAQT